jgi:hypothetical protein
VKILESRELCLENHDRRAQRPRSAMRSEIPSVQLTRTLPVRRGPRLRSRWRDQPIQRCLLRAERSSDPHPAECSEWDYFAALQVARRRLGA